MSRRFTPPAQVILCMLVQAACNSSTSTSPPPTPVAATTGTTTTVATGHPRVDVATVGNRAAHTATTLSDGTIYVAGGCITDGCSTATTDTFLIAADGVTATAGVPMSVARDSHTANVASDGRVVLAGGYPGEGAGATASIEIVDPAIGTVDQRELFQGRGGHASAVLRSGQVVIVGGWIRSRTYTSTVELINAEAGTVTQVAKLPWAADALDAVTLTDGRILVTGGQIAPNVPTANAAVFDPDTLAWTVVAPMETARFKHFTVLLDDGRVLVMGGDTGNQAITATTEIFDATTSKFTPGPNLFEPRYKFPGGALVVDDGRVLIGGGGTTAEILDIGAGTSTVIGKGRAAGSFATLNRLGSGDYIVIGGYDDRIDLRRVVTVIPAADID